MKFQEAFDKVAEQYDKMKIQNPDFNGAMSLDALKGAAFAWNVIALALSEKGTEKGLDDFVFIVNNDIKSIPLSEQKGEKAEDDKNVPDKENKAKNKKGKGKSPQPETANDEAVDGQEETTEESSEQQSDS